MPLKDLERRKEYDKQRHKIYYQKNKERIKLYQERNKEKIRERRKVKKYWLKWRNNNTGKYKIIQKKSNKKYRVNNKEKIKSKILDNKLKVYNHYSNYDIKCNCCGEKHIEFLTLDHINNDGAEHRKQFKSPKGLINWIIKNNFPPIFQILCFNCNCGRALNPDKICPHQIKKAEQILN